MRLTTQHKRDIYIAVLQPFYKDVMIALAIMAEELDGTEFVHSIFDEQPLDVDQQLNALAHINGMSNPAGVHTQIINLHTCAILKELLASQFGRDLHSAGAHARLDSDTIALYKVKGGPEAVRKHLFVLGHYFCNGYAMHQGVITKEWATALTEGRFKQLAETDTDVPDNLRSAFATMPPAYPNSTNIYIPTIPSIWEKFGKKELCINYLKAASMALHMHKAMELVLKAGTYKKLLTTMPTLRTIIPDYIHTAAGAEAPSKQADTLDVDMQVVTNALTTKRLQGLI